MKNHPRGIVSIEANDQEWPLKLTWGALAQMQTELGLDTPDAVLENIRPKDLIVVLKCLMAGGGNHLTDKQMLELDVEDPEQMMEAIRDAFVQSKITKFQTGAKGDGGHADENPKKGETSGKNS